MQYCIQGFFMNLNSVSKLSLDTQNSSVVESLPSAFAKIIKIHHYVWLGRNIPLALI